MRPEVATWVKSIVEEYHPKPPVLEVGALNVNGSIRSLFPEPYTGLDMQEGPGVNLVLDVLESPLEGGYNTIVCCETLEHITRPWEALERLYGALSSGGLFIGTWCFSFPIHDYPVDYWRVTPSGFRYLLERVGFYHVRIDTEGPGPRGVFAVAEK